MAYEAILSGNDAVLLSETGSGKTLAYALPILNRLIGEAEEQNSVKSTGQAVSQPLRSPRRLSQVLVLQPNRDLCAQVLSVFRRFLEALPDNLHQQLSVSSLVSEVDADTDATILIATPSVALKLWNGPDNVRIVVLDEADALLAGSFKPAARAQYPVEILIAAVKRAAKEEAIASGAPRWDGPRGAVGAEARAARAVAYASKQFVLVGATMPNAGTKNMEGHVRRLLPRAEWHRASHVHRGRTELSQYFVKVDDNNRGEALRQALRHGPQGRTLIFANTLPMAQEAYAEALILASNQKEMTGLYHAELPNHERAELLCAFANGSLSTLVCTGLASRGIDFVDVAHVVQYEVALNAVEFMHRVGRTARAGKPGTATALYTNDRTELVEGLRNALDAGTPIEHLFSRKRSFKLKLKKRQRHDASGKPL